MKRHLIILATTACLTWWGVGLLLPRKTPVQETVAKQSSLALARSRSSSSLPPKLSSRWLASTSRVIEKLPETELGAWEAKIADWPPVIKALTEQLLEARRAALYPHKPQKATRHDSDLLAKALIRQLSGESIEEIVATLEAIDHRGSNVVSEAARDLFFKLLTREHPQKAAKVSSQLRDQHARTNVSRIVANTWASHDAEACLRWIEAMPVGNEPARLGSAIAEQLLAGENPLAALDFVDRLKELGSQVKSPRIAWALKYPEKARAWISENPDAALGNSIALTLAHSNPKEATQWLDQITDSKSMERAVGWIVDEWWSQSPNPKEALIWAMQQESTTGRVVAAGRMANNDPEAGLKLLENAWDSGSDLTSHFEKSLAEIANHAPDLVRTSSLLGELEEIPGDVIGEIARKSAAEAAALMDQYNHSARHVDIAKIWLEQDAAAAATWVSQLPEETLDQITREFVSEWVEKDGTAARAWAEASLAKDSKAYKEAMKRLPPIQ